MNNNRNNNRRRGRGNNRQQGGQQLNRIDSRARGNAPQLLEKYRKLAHDAHLNGDRVTEEYNLQFADHYFRVIADQRLRQEENRQPRREDRGPEYVDDYGEDDYYADPYDRVPAAPQPANGGERSDRGDRNDRGERNERNDRGDRGSERSSGRGDRDGRDGGRDAGRENGRDGRRPERAPRVEAQADAPAPEAEGGEAVGDPSIYEPVENPFLREGRTPRTPRECRPRRPREAVAPDGADSEPSGFDPASLPPSISRAEAPVAEDVPAEEAAAKPKRRTRRAAPKSDASGDDAGALETVN